VAEILVAFYVDDGLIASQDPVWLQEFFGILVGLFEQVGLFTNAAKTKVMLCIPGRIREGYTKEGYAKYKSQTVTAANKKRRRVNCEICGASLAAGAYQSHLESQHDVGYRGGLPCCGILCYRIDRRGQVLLPNAALRLRGEHEVGSKTAFSSSPPTGSCRVAE
jgi:hypothetical protein